jgi:hypothetical protein
MSEANQEARPARSANLRRVALLVLAVLAGCSGRSPFRAAHDGAAALGADGEDRDVPSATGGSAQGGGDGPTRGAGGVGTGGTGGSSTGAGGSGPVRDGGGSEGVVDAYPDGWCDETLLWDAIARAAPIGVGYCMRFIPEYDHPSGWIRSVGYVVLDGDGRVVDNTELSGAGKQAWLDGLATVRWPCLAGQTMQYLCIDFPI